MTIPLDQPSAPKRETPGDWPWPTWYEAAVNYRAIADELGQQVTTLEAKLAKVKEIVG